MAEIAVAMDQVTLKLNNKTIINNLSFQIPKGSITLLKGKNGVGKSLTLKLMTQLITPNAGNITVSGHTSYAPDSFPENIKLTTKSFLTTIQNLNMKRKSDSQTVDDYLALLSLSSLQNTKLHHLSKGSLQKVNIIQSLLTDADILVFDEPFSGLDKTSEAQFLTRLQQLSKTKTIIITDHDANIEHTIATHILSLDDYTFIPQSKHQELKTITISNQQSVGDVIEHDLASWVHVKATSNHQYVTLQVDKENVNIVLQHLLKHNCEIIEVKDL
ncbi:ATP-binding cassette domain-containing protein [Staphylococcus xylosus]|uniref:ATP-binding cassette domain-containing protein n=1 Tax=Staphylococcus xylosus TaxID=1288 RepID=UPI000852F212|nr:ATP-binding cassette domain-containing protein [Staphylococcus xylosus]MCR1812377.1 ATP-binding cassette domain-containing protein [Staphylococcus xylosus]MDG5480635.1 ATP-binding cassette domain-containing protein [Staphylococcus xylosus]MEB6228764.1 ATP-binding cassette domain-containing protein [Staphylococcus xylosus]MEB6244945.1 ATP-binding cassette domain-containing protein [Staphylococcus xylosus]MEB7766359.1 ATP-binding cassette domain-containing protein [Staphylococcus xylosus]